MFLTTIGKKEGRTELTNILHKVKVRKVWYLQYTCTVQSVHWKNRIETEPVDTFGSLHCTIIDSNANRTNEWNNNEGFLFTQCCGSSSGSVCFWAIRIRILPSSSKNSKKTLDFCCLWLLHDFWSLKNDVNVPLFRIRMFLGLLDPHSDPLVRGTDPRIRISIRIRTTIQIPPHSNKLKAKNKG